MDLSNNMLKWMFLALAVFAYLSKYFWAASLYRKRGIVVRSRIFSFYSPREFIATSSLEKKKFMNHCNWITGVFWFALFFALLFWMTAFWVESDL